MTKHFIGTKAQCEALQAAADRLMGYPRTVTKGLLQAHDAAQLAADALLLTGQEDFVERHVAKVSMPTYAKARRHPSTTEWAYPVTAELSKADTAGLGATDKQTIDGAKAAAADLSEDWEPAEAKAGVSKSVTRI